MTKYIFIFTVLLFASCDDNEAEKIACEQATKEYEDAHKATETFRAYVRATVPSTCNPCDVQQAASIQLTKLVQFETSKKSAKLKACNY